MVEHIKENQVRYARLAKGKLIAIADQIEPGVGKQIRADGSGKVALEIANARTDLQNCAGNLRIDEGDDAFVKAGVDLLEQRLGIPGTEVLLDLLLVLIQIDHAKNLSRRAANQTMRISNQPCFQREMLVSP